MTDEVTTAAKALETAIETKVAVEPNKVAGKIDAPVSEALTSADGWIHTHPKLAAAAVVGIVLVVITMLVKIL